MELNSQVKCKLKVKQHSIGIGISLQPYITSWVKYDKLNNCHLQEAHPSWEPYGVHPSRGATKDHHAKKVLLIDLDWKQIVILGFGISVNFIGIMSTLMNL